jgi:hypothetical protein
MIRLKILMQNNRPSILVNNRDILTGGMDTENQGVIDTFLCHQLFVGGTILVCAN